MSEFTPSTRCLLCSLACPVAFEVRATDGGSEIRTGHVASAPFTQGRLCFRGHYLAEMAVHPLRLTQAVVRNGSEAGAKKVAPDGALAELASRLSKAQGDVAVIVAGGLPTEDISAALRLGREVLGTPWAAVYLPPGDALMLKGLAPSVPVLSAEHLPECDLCLAVGDIFATHPVLSRPLLERRAARKTRLAALDSLPNRVSAFAERFVHVRPGGEAPALAALVRLLGGRVADDHRWAAGRSPEDLAQEAGADLPVLQAVADALKEAERPAIVLDPVAGRTGNIIATAAMASALCGACGGRLAPMFASGNAVGAASAAASLGAAALSEVLQAVREAKVEVLFLIGVDLPVVVGEREARDIRRCVSTLAVGSDFRNATTEAADIVLPLAAGFEEDGSIAGVAGGSRRLTALVSPPGGALPARVLCEELAVQAGAALGPPPDVVPGLPFEGSAVEEILTAGEEGQGLRLVARADTVDFGGGSVSRLLAWPRLVEPVPVLRLSAGDARKRHLRSLSKVLVRANGHEARATLEVTETATAGVAEISPAFRQTAPLFRRVPVPGGDGTEPTWTEAEVFAETDA